MYCLLSKDQADLAPADERVLPVFSGANSARAYREGRGLSLHYEVAEVPDLELLRGLLRAHSRGVLTVALDPQAGPSRAVQTEFALSDPWRAFVELLRLERASMTRGCSDGM